MWFSSNRVSSLLASYTFDWRSPNKITSIQPPWQDCSAYQVIQAYDDSSMNPTFNFLGDETLMGRMYKEFLEAFTQFQLEANMLNRDEVPHEHVFFESDVPDVQTEGWKGRSVSNTQPAICSLVSIMPSWSYCNAVGALHGTLCWDWYTPNTQLWLVHSDHCSMIGALHITMAVKPRAHSMRERRREWCVHRCLHCTALPCTHNDVCNSTHMMRLAMMRLAHTHDDVTGLYVSHTWCDWFTTHGMRWLCRYIIEQLLKKGWKDVNGEDTLNVVLSPNSPDTVNDKIRPYLEEIQEMIPAMSSLCPHYAHYMEDQCSHYQMMMVRCYVYASHTICVLHVHQS